MIREIKFRVWHKKEKKMYARGYQKWFHVLLCEDDGGTAGGRGIPVKRESYDPCEFLEGTGIEDIHGREVYEGDIVRVSSGTLTFTGIVGEVPDMFRSRGLHPLHGLLSRHGLGDKIEDLRVEVLGNRFENLNLMKEVIP